MIPTLLILRGRTGAGKTTLLNQLARQLNFKGIEIDQLKIKKYGDTTHCNPNIDFPDVGEQISILLKQQFNVVVEEAFLLTQHIELVVNAVVGVEYEVVYIMLQCSEQAAIRRKKSLSLADVKRQYLRRVEPVPGEWIFNTDLTELDTIIEKIKMHLKSK